MNKSNLPVDQCHIRLRNKVLSPEDGKGNRSVLFEGKVHSKDNLGINAAKRFARGLMGAKTQVRTSLV